MFDELFRANARRRAGWRCCLLGFLTAAAVATPGRADEPAAEGVAFFEKRIRPLLVQHCYPCHSAQAPKLKGGLRLDTRDGVRKGGATGPAVLPGDVGRSLLLRAVRYEDDVPHMPPTARL